MLNETQSRRSPDSRVSDDGIRLRSDMALRRQTPHMQQVQRLPLGSDFGL